MGEHILGSEQLTQKQLEKTLLLALQNLLRGTGLVHSVRVAGPRELGADVRIELNVGRIPYTLFLDVRSSAQQSDVFQAIGRSTLAKVEHPQAVWILGAPFVSENAAELCRKGGISYIDSIGNYDIRFDTILLTRRTPSPPPVSKRKVQMSLFSRKASRVSLALLLDPRRRWTQRALAAEVGLSLGLVNRTVRRLAEEGYVEWKDGEGRLLQWDALLDAWAKEYIRQRPEQLLYFSRATIEELESLLDRDAAERGYRYALTGETAAKYRAPFAPTTRLVFYCDAEPEVVAQILSLKPVEVGGNVVMLRPRDEGVFYRTRRATMGTEKDVPGIGRTITNDMYLYLDLLAAGGRGAELAEHLRQVREREPKHRGLSTEEAVRLHDMLKWRDRGHDAVRERKWAGALEFFETALLRGDGVLTETAVRERKSITFWRWLCLLNVAKEHWEDRHTRRKFLEEVRREIPEDEEILDRYPPYELAHATLRYMLALRHAILAAAGGPTRDQHASITASHLKIATSPYTEGSRYVVEDAEKLKQWLIDVADIRLVY